MTHDGLIFCSYNHAVGSEGRTRMYEGRPKAKRCDCMHFFGK